MNQSKVSRWRRFRWRGAAKAVAGALSLALLACSGDGGGRSTQVDSIQAPAGTVRAVFFEYVARCKRNTAPASSNEPESSCTIEIVGASILEPDRNGKVTIDRNLEVAHADREHADSWDEQGVELVAYGPKGSAAFTTRGWHYYDVWTPGKGPARFVIDSRAANTTLPEAERRSFALEPMAASIETLVEVPQRLRLDLRPYVEDLASMLEALVVDPGLSNESRERVAEHLSALDEAMRGWGVDWLARRGVESTGS